MQFLNLGGDVHILVAGHNAQSVADAASKLTGVAKVLYAENAILYENQLAEPMGALIYSLSWKVMIILLHRRL